MAFIRTMWGMVVNADCYECFLVCDEEEGNGYMVVGYLRGKESETSRKVLGIYSRRKAAEEVLFDIARNLDAVRMEEDRDFDHLRKTLALREDREELGISEMNAVCIGEKYGYSIPELMRSFRRGEIRGVIAKRQTEEILKKLGLLGRATENEQKGGAED